jgi:uncharacterized membrane-anchored protein
MTRALGVFVVWLAMMATATAEDKAEKQPAKPTAKAKSPKQPPPEAAPPAEEEAAEDAELTPEEIEATLPPHINGPKLVDLGHNIEINVPEGMLLLERAEAQKMLAEGGDFTDNVLAIVGKVDAEWLIVIEFADVGYVDDSDANQLDANELFRQFEEGTRQQNIKRKSLGVPELFLDGWSEMPSYKHDKNQLVWGLKGHSSDGPVINFFTRILGRHGYLSVNLIDSPDQIEKSKVDSASVLTSLSFRKGSTYADHQDDDKSSGLGLRALVLGGTGVAVAKAAKAGILIKLLLVFKKAFLFIILGVAGFFKWLFGRKKRDEYTPPPDDDPVTPPAE